MPIWLRKFTFNKLKEHYNPKKDDVVDESIKNMKIAPKIPKPTPTYSTKASKK